MRKQQRKVAGKRGNPTSVYLTPDDKAILRELRELKYHGLGGITTVFRKEGMERGREEIKRLKAHAEQ